MRTSHAADNHRQSRTVASSSRNTDDLSRPVFVAFPEHERRLHLLLDVDAEFVELCEDFDAVVTAYEKGMHEDGALRSCADEYHSLRLELETEILLWLRQGSKPEVRP